MTYFSTVHFGESSIWVLSSQLQVWVRLAQKVLLVQSNPIPSQLQHLLAVPNLLSSDLCTEHKCVTSTSHY